jgi:hypothetical protein
LTNASAGKHGSYESEGIYYTAEAAEKRGREQIELLGSNAKKLGKPKTAADYIWEEWGSR